MATDGGEDPCDFIETHEISATVKDQDSKKNTKRGLIYISTIPPFMNVIRIREIFGQYGQVGRVYLQLRETDKEKGSEKKKKKRKLNVQFTEGWVEFERKSVAKQVAATLNSVRIGERKKSKFYDYIWNIKYLTGFKWIHLSERLAYEKAVFRQKLRTEISQAKRESNYFSHNMEQSHKLQKRKKNLPQGTEYSEVNNLLLHYQQKETEPEVRFVEKDQDASFSHSLETTQKLQNRKTKRQKGPQQEESEVGVYSVRKGQNDSEMERSVLQLENPVQEIESRRDFLKKLFGGTRNIKSSQV